MNMHSADEKSFTLLELLVVITIIGILSSIVIVSMSGSTDSATIAKGKAYAQQVHALLGANAVGVWNFDEGTGTIVKDISGYGNSGTIHGASWISSDIEGYALSFNGEDSYVDCGNDSVFDITDEVTIEGWVKFSSGAGSSLQKIIGKIGGAYQFGVNSGNQMTTWWNGSWRVSSEILWSDNQWYHLVMAVESGTMRFYRNGEYISNVTDVGSAIVSTDNVEIGKTLSTGFVDGIIDEVRIYSEALPSTEIQKHYVQGLEKLLANQAITQAEYIQRMEEFNQSSVLYEQ
jgi:prepilin-type N-terminal cleavage/methylation domain-containing protein